MFAESNFESTYLNDEIFDDRQHAGKHIGQRLKFIYPQSPPPVLVAIGRGGIPVACEAAKVLGSRSINAIACRKLPCNANRHVAMGVASAEGIVVLDEKLVRLLNVPANDMERKKQTAIKDAKFDQTVFAAAGASTNDNLCGADVVIIDDGVSTGMTALAAIRSVQRCGARSIRLACPVISEDMLGLILRECDEVIYLFKMTHILYIDDYYHDFPRVTLAECTQLLAQSQNLEIPRA